MITTIIRTVILYIFVTFGIRIMGKRQIGDMQPNELVITLLISEIAAIPLQAFAEAHTDAHYAHWEPDGQTGHYIQCDEPLCD